MKKNSQKRLCHPHRLPEQTIRRFPQSGSHHGHLLHTGNGCDFGGMRSRRKDPLRNRGSWRPYRDRFFTIQPQPEIRPDARERPLPFRGSGATGMASGGRTIHRNRLLAGTGKTYPRAACRIRPTAPQWRRAFIQRFLGHTAPGVFPVWKPESVPCHPLISSSLPDRFFS